MNGADRMMNEYLGQVATTEQGRSEYLRLAQSATDTVEQWRGLEGSVGGPIAGATDHLLSRLQDPLRLSINGRALDGRNVAVDELYRATYTRLVENNEYLSAMKKAWLEGQSEIVENASAIRLLTWQSRDAYDESEYLAGLIGPQAARAIRQQVKPSRTSSTRESVGAPKPKPRLTKTEIADPINVYREIAWLQGRNPDDVREQVERRIKNGMNQTESIVTEYGAQPVAGALVGIDLETTGTSVNQDYIIDAGWELFDMAMGCAFEAQRRTYGISKQRERLGISRNITELTGITTADVSGRIPFQEDANAQKTIITALDGRIMVAHNANFERSFLIGNCEGYAEALRDGRIRIVDSMKVAQHSEDARVQGFKLDDYARRNHALDADRDMEVPSHDGGAIRLDQGEKERHLGLEDAHIMMRAMRNQLNALHFRYEHGEQVMQDVN